MTLSKTQLGLSVSATLLRVPCYCSLFTKTHADVTLKVNVISIKHDVTFLTHLLPLVVTICHTSLKNPGSTPTSHNPLVDVLYGRIILDFLSISTV